MRNLILLFTIIFTLLGTGCAMAPPRPVMSAHLHTNSANRSPAKSSENHSWFHFRGSDRYRWSGSRWVLVRKAPEHSRHRHHQRVRARH